MAVYEVLNVGILQLQVFTVATAPDATKYTGCWIYVTDGNAGSPGMAYSNGTNWLNPDDLAAIATS